MSTSVVYLDPASGTPPVIEIDGICYSQGPQTSAPSATTSYDNGSGCCPQNPAPYVCPDGLNSTYTLNADGVGPLTLTRIGTDCTWSIVFTNAIEWTLTLAGTSPNCYWALSAHELGQNDASGVVTKSVGSDPTGRYTNYNEYNQHAINNAVIS